MSNVKIQIYKVVGLVEGYNYHIKIIYIGYMKKDTIFLRWSHVADMWVPSVTSMRRRIMGRLNTP